MNRKTVKSSNLESVGYDANSNTLEIEFKDGDVYQYFDVPERIYTGLMNAASHGSYFDRFVKKAGYRYKKIG
ncbi:MAG: KTSC domain-containing protein [Proteobacteria bacterium]|nr:MAG: KTSC domain-containing protein [Pseudomonadota bacterium]